MFLDLIYTHCRQGIDILKDGKQVMGDGYKIYACSHNIMTSEKNDLPFLVGAAQAKQSYNDPSFMDDAYLYYVPNNGSSFMDDFHPVPFDPNARGDFPHRPGNFVNQILIGDFSHFYLFELFGDKNVWYAKNREVAYYYENAPENLPQREIQPIFSQTFIDKVKAFINDGRKDALMHAVSFLISQYKLPPKDRKFLLIRDESSENIEMWIAAIEYAFSPKMAAAIPFATRMDKFVMTNRYTVNKLGIYQTQINLQDENQELRLRAMIVGVDERDKNNSANARPLPNSPFVLLDGKEKKAMFEAEVSNAYYQFITNFDETRDAFCRKFLQMFDITKPDEEIYKLLDIYMTFGKPKLPKAQELLETLSVLAKYKLADSSYMQEIYSRICAELPTYLQEDFDNTLKVVNHLKGASGIMKDSTWFKKFTGTVSETFATKVYEKVNLDAAIKFWQKVKLTEFAKASANVFLKNANTDYINHLEYTDLIHFFCLYLECAKASELKSEDQVRSLTHIILVKCIGKKDINTLRNISKVISAFPYINLEGMLLASIKSLKNDTEGYTKFIISFIIELHPGISSSDSSMLNFLQKLKTQGINNLCKFIIDIRLKSISGPDDIEQFILTLKKIDGLSDNELINIFTALDNKLIITDKIFMKTALTIQKERPKDMACIESAHISALEALDNKDRRERFVEIYTDLTKQGFPSDVNSDYIYILISKLLSAQLSKNELKYVIELFASIPPYINELIAEIMKATTPKQNGAWITLIATAANKQDDAITNAIVMYCSKLKHSQKEMQALNNLLQVEDSILYFKQIMEMVIGADSPQKPKTLFGKLFGKKS
ncbi:MAG: hypothetical protein LBM77_00925 [Spirochaetaceae bacterium]|jgi:hypothetical protein|nr:hypothetical protein [Spirochaetaceae bacterium]